MIYSESPGEEKRRPGCQVSKPVTDIAWNLERGAYFEVFHVHIVYDIVLEQAAVKDVKDGEKGGVLVRLTNWTYCPTDPNAMPFPPRHMASLTYMFVEFCESLSLGVLVRQNDGLCSPL